VEEKTVCTNVASPHCNKGGTCRSGIRTASEERIGDIRKKFQGRTRAFMTGESKKKEAGLRAMRFLRGNKEGESGVIGIQLTNVAKTGGRQAGGNQRGYVKE